MSATVGQIDMSTAQAFSDHVFRYAGNCRRLTLDLRDVTFSTAPGSPRCHIDDRCHMAAVTWTVEPAACVSRVLEFCDPLRRLPISTEEASDE